MKLLLFILFWGASSPTNPWVLEKETEGISIWIKDEKDFYRVKAEATIDGSIQDFAILFETFSSHANWSSKLTSVQIIEQRNNSWTLLMQMKAFPLKNRYQLVECNRIDSHNSITYNISQSSKTIQENLGVRVLDVDGYWKATQTSDNTIKITQEIYANPNISLPKSWARSQISKEIVDTFKSIKQNL